MQQGTLIPLTPLSLQEGKADLPESCPHASQVIVKEEIETCSKVLRSQKGNHGALRLPLLCGHAVGMFTMNPWLI